MIYQPASIGAAQAVGENMRRTDVAEMLALGLNPRTIPVESILMSDDDLCWSLVDGTDVVGVCGARGLNPDVGVVWLLTADGFGRHPRRVLDVTRELLDIMHSRYSVLFNWIDNRNLRSLRWLRAAGFFPTVTDPDYCGSGYPFTCYIHLSTPPCATR